MSRKINEKDPERDQGDSTCDKNEEFLDLETSPASKMSSGEQNRVLTHSIERPTWLDELVSESNTIQAQEDITQQGVIAGTDPVKLNVVLGWLLVHISGLLNSFGLASFVCTQNISLLH